MFSQQINRTLTITIKGRGGEDMTAMMKKIKIKLNSKNPKLSSHHAKPSINKGRE